MLCGNHGIGWSIYFPDPEGNLLECFVDSEWYVDQPVLTPLDFSQSDEEILAATKASCEQPPGFDPIANWRTRSAAKMQKFEPPRSERQTTEPQYLMRTPLAHLFFTNKHLLVKNQQT